MARDLAVIRRPIAVHSGNPAPILPGPWLPEDTWPIPRPLPPRTPLTSLACALPAAPSPSRRSRVPALPETLLVQNQRKDLIFLLFLLRDRFFFSLSFNFSENLLVEPVISLSSAFVLDLWEIPLKSGYFCDPGKLIPDLKGNIFLVPILIGGFSHSMV